MSGYKRIVSYIYVYESGERKENTGFARVDVRNGEYRIAIHLRGFYAYGQEPYRAYLYAPKEKRLEGIFLGQLENQNGALEWKGSLTTDTWDQAAYGLEESRGIFIEGAGGRVYASDWDDYPVDVDSFRVYQEQAEKPEIESEVVLEQADSVEVEAVETETVVSETLETEIFGEDWEISEKEQAGEEKAEKKPETVADIEVESLQAAEVKAPVCPVEERPLDSRQEKWKYLTRRFPVQQLFQNGKGPMSCIRIGPGELQRFPRGSWMLGNNSFLLHGYYQYRHLLLCRYEPDRARNVEYYLGVPGIYNEKEQMMAEMFGFAEFRRSGSPGNQNGNFGYWFRKIEES